MTSSKSMLSDLMNSTINLEKIMKGGTKKSKSKVFKPILQKKKAKK